MTTSNLPLLPAEPAVPEPRSARAETMAQPDFLEAEYSEVHRWTLRECLWVVHKHRRLAGACFCISLGLAVLYTLLTPRLYTASTLIEVPRRSPILLPLKDNVLEVESPDRIVNGASSFLATQVQALKSRDIAERVIRERHLADNQDFAPAHRWSAVLSSIMGLLSPSVNSPGPGWAVSCCKCTGCSPPPVIQCTDSAVGLGGCDDFCEACSGTHTFDVAATCGVGAFTDCLAVSGVQALARERLRAFLIPRGVGRAAGDGAGSAEVEPKLLNLYMRYLDVNDVRGSDLIQVRFTTRSPELSAFLAAAHTEAYLDQNRDAQLSTDASAVGFLDQQLQQSREHVERAAAAVSQFAGEHPNVAVNQEDQLIGTQITDLAGLITEAEGARIAAQSRYQYLSRASTQPGAPFFDDNPAIQKLRLVLIDIEAQRSAIETRLGPNHPQMIDLRRETRQLGQRLHNEVRQEVSTARSRYQAAQAREKELQSKLQQLEQSAIALRELGGQYDLVKGDLDNARALHDSLLKQRSETAVHSQLDAAGIRVIERAEVPDRPSRPSIPVNLALGAFAGIGLGLGAAFLRETLDDSVKSSTDVQGLLQLPTLAAIPSFRLRRQAGSRLPFTARVAAGNGRSTAVARRRNGQNLCVFSEPGSRTAECFRSLRTALLFSDAENPPRTILVTSAGENEGKTVTAVNLAAAFAAAGSKVLLLDADLRLGACHHILGTANDRGLSSFLAGETDLESVIINLDSPRLAFIPAGPKPSNPAELVGSARMREGLTSLRARYDFVIVDSPPVLPVTDATVLGRSVEGVVLVVKGEDTPREIVRRARDLLLSARVNLVGVVVNNVGEDWGQYYFSRNYRGYHRRDHSVQTP